MSGLAMKYFVLNPVSSDKTHAEASRAAMRAYAVSVRHARQAKKRLADDLDRWVDSCDATDPKENPPGLMRGPHAGDMLGAEDKFDELIAQRGPVELVRSTLGMDCDDEGCPHYGTPHAHIGDVKDFHGEVTHTIIARPKHGNLLGAEDESKTVLGDLKADPHSSAHYRPTPKRTPNLLLDGPPDGWHIERDEKQNPTGYLIKTEDGTRKWHTDKVFHEFLK